MKKIGFDLFRYNKIIIVIVCVSFTISTFSQNQFDSIDININKYIKDNNIPGFACCIVREDKIYWHNSYGKANIEKDIPMTIDAIMNIASISKTFTTTAALQLWEKGLINLDADINDYLDLKIRNPKYPETPITIFQILTHTSSINDANSYVNSYSCGDPTISLSDWIYNYLTPDGKYYIQNENFCDWKPGSKEKYSNVAFGLLGLIIEEVANIPFNEYCRKNIFSPLGMKNTGWFLYEIDTLNHITPYEYIWDVGLLREYPKNKLKTLSTNCPLCLYSFPNYPDGLVRTSVRELSLFLIPIMNKGVYNNSRILKESTIEKMLTLQLDDNNSQGLCWSKSEFESLWGHSGGDPGVSTNMYFNPDTKVGVITFQNNKNGKSFEVLKKLYLTIKEQHQ